MELALASLNYGYLVVFLIVLFILMGMPIAFALGATAAIAIILDPGVQPAIIGVAPFGGANNYLLAAAVLFMVTGELMNEGDIARRLIDFASSLVGHIRGGLAHVNIVTSLFFAGISGTATADAAAIGSVMIPQMEKRGFAVNFAAAVTATSATLSIIVPPSLNLILYAYVSGTSVARLFTAGIVPGLLVASGLIAAAYGVSIKEDYPVEHEFRWRRVVDTGKYALLPMTIPVLVLWGLLGGIFTATEAGRHCGSGRPGLGCRHLSQCVSAPNGVGTAHRRSAHGHADLHCGDLLSPGLVFDPAANSPRHCRRHSQCFG
jgi:C4-dicarboxylate transporter DctM subunit